MGKDIKTSSKRPIFFLAFLFLTIGFAYYSFNTVGYYWTVLIPNILLLYITTVLLVVYLESGHKYGQPRSVQEYAPVTVVIPSYNCKDLIRNTIESIKDSDYPSEVEILVVDDGSSDGTRETLNDEQGIRLVIKEKNEGKASALNTGIRAASHDYIFCVDSDSFVSKNALKDMMAKMLSEDRVGAVTCFVKVANNKSLICKVQEIEYFVGFGFSAITNYLLDAVFVTPGPMTLFKNRPHRSRPIRCEQHNRGPGDGLAPAQGRIPDILFLRRGRLHNRP